MTGQNIELLKKGAEQMGVLLSEKSSSDLNSLIDMLMDWNTRMNLTAVKEEDDAVKKHLLDSLALAGICGLKEEGSMVDVGCGAGFPALPIKIIYPKKPVTALDATKKKLDFIQNVIKQLHLNGCECLHTRAEEAGRMKNMREKFDAATARAVAELRVLSEYCLPLVKKGGTFYAMKGPDVDGEATNAKNAIRELGGEIEEIKQFTLPQSDLNRTLVIIRKVKSTPERYPRANAKIEKNPL